MVDASLEMTRVTLDVLERTIFTQGVSGTRMRSAAPSPAISTALGRVDPLDIFGFPDWVPRIGRLRARPAIRFFEEVVNELIEAPQGAARQRGARAPRPPDPSARSGRSAKPAGA